MSNKAAGRILIAIFSMLIIGSCLLVFAARLPYWFTFDEKDALSEWEEKIFKGRVIYSVKVEERGGYLSAYSKESASGILYRLRFDPQTHPKISWKWKVVKFPEKGVGKESGSRWIEKDDYAARFYVIFPRFPFKSTQVLEYVWDKSLPSGTIMTSPYFENLKLIVVESGEKAGEWVYEERNLLEDFKMAFNRRPGGVGAIAVMTDTDNTISTAETHYDEIKVGYKNGVQ